MINSNFVYSLTSSMASKNSLETLSSGRRLLRWIHLYNRKKISVGPIKVPDFVVYLVLWLPSIYVGFAVGWHLLEEFHLDQVSLSIANAIMIISLLSEYATLALNTSAVTTTFDHLQSFTQQSIQFPSIKPVHTKLSNNLIF